MSREIDLTGNLDERIKELELCEPLLHRAKKIAEDLNFTKEEYLMGAVLIYAQAHRDLLLKLEAIVAGLTRPIIKHGPIA